MISVVSKSTLLTPKRRSNESYYNNPHSSSDNTSSRMNVDGRDYAPPKTELEVRVCTQAERLAHLRNACADLKRRAIKLSVTPPLQYLMGDDIHKLLYCIVSKAGCTMIRTVLAKANIAALGLNLTLPRYEMGIHTPRYLELLKLVRMLKLDRTGMLERLKSYYMFMVVRHPFSRLVSVWRDKIVNIKQSEYKKWPEEILRRYRPWLFDKLPGQSQVNFAEVQPTFAEFLQWIAETRKQNKHWMPVETACHVCGQSWNAVLRTETMDTDQRILLDQLGEDYDASQFPRVHSFTGSPATASSATRLDLFEGVRKDVLGYFMLMYKQDMELFGYKWNGDTNTVSCSIQTEHGPCC